MANNQPAIETLEGRVSQSRPDGIKLQDAEGQESEWLNVSQYHPLDTIPDRGALIEVQVTRSGRTAKPYILALSPLTQDPLPLRVAPPQSSAQPSPSSAQPSPASARPSASIIQPSPSADALPTISPVASHPSPASSPAQPVPSFPDPALSFFRSSVDREELMTRMSALKSAVALATLVASVRPEAYPTSESVLATATDFLNWLRA